MTTLIKDLIDIPEKVHKGDFVLRLTEGITDDHAKATLDNYVVTPQLVECFDEALGVVDRHGQALVVGFSTVEADVEFGSPATSDLERLVLRLKFTCAPAIGDPRLRPHHETPRQHRKER